MTQSGEDGTYAYCYAEHSISLAPQRLEAARDFSGGTVVKHPPANAGDTGSSPGLGRSHMPQSN